MTCLSYLTASEPRDFCRLCENVPFEHQDIDVLPGICAWSDKEIAVVRHVLRRLTLLRVRNDEDAEDLVQETLLTAVAKLPDRSLHKGLLVWCMGVLRKKVGNYYRKASRYTSLNNCEALTWRFCREEVRARSPEAILRQAELQTLVEEILAGLPLRERGPVELYLAGLSAWEIAELLYPERYQNVLNRIFRGRQKLAHRLARYGYAPAGWRR